MRPLQILVGTLGVVAVASGLLLLINADRDVGGALIISGAILIAGLAIASAITERK
jgi:hypothetical protein